MATPLGGMGVDVVNSLTTTVTSGLVTTVLGKTAGIRAGAASVLGSMFNVFALVMTAGVEMAMELARGNARLILIKVAEKDAVIKKIRVDIITLNNAILVLLNSAPFSSAYRTKLLQAYKDIDNGNKALKGVVSTLSAVHRFDTNRYNLALSNLTAAQTLIFPDQTANIKAITSGRLQDTTPFVEAATGLAAALIIPGLTANIARNWFIYATRTAEINLLVPLFQTALNEYINGYQRNANIDKVTIDNINVATSGLDTLTNNMSVMLFPTDGSDKSPFYSTKLISTAPVWGITLTGIIEWLKVNPGVVGSQQLDMTGESIRRYNLAVSALSDIGDIKSGTAILRVNAAVEDIIDTSRQLTRILLVANTVISNPVLNNNVLGEIRSLSNLMSAAASLDNKIKSALTPFINTPNNLLAGADKVIGNLNKLAKNSGFDKFTDTLSKGDFKGLFSMTAETATFVGAGIYGVHELLKKVKSNPAATDQDAQKLTNIADDMDREQAAKKVEASVTSTDNKDLAIQQLKQKLAVVKKRAQESKAVDAKYSTDPTTAISDLDKIKNQVQNITKNKFGFL